MLHLVPLFLGASALLSAPAVTDDLWHDNFDVAAKLAKEQGKDLLVDFTGSDWCGWCIRLDNEVFSKDEFRTTAVQDYVLVKLDFPRAEEVKAKVPNPERNSELSDKYGITGFPTILLMSADGDVYAKTGYQAGGPVKYVEHLGEIRTSGRAQLVATKEVVAAFEAAQGEARVAAWERAVEALSALSADSPFASLLAGPVRWALEHDAANEKGMKLRAVEALLEAGQGDEAVLTAARELDPNNEKGLLERVVNAQFQSVTDDEGAKAAVAELGKLNAIGFKNKELAFDLNATAAQWAMGPLDDKELAKKHARIALDAGSDNERAVEWLKGLLIE